MKAKIYTVFRKRIHGSHTSHMSKVFLPNQLHFCFQFITEKFKNRPSSKNFFFIFTYGENSVGMSFVTEFKDENHNYLFKE